MAAGHELIPGLIAGIVSPPILTGLWAALVHVHNRVIDKIGKGRKVEPHSLRLLVQLYLIFVSFTLIHSCAK
jgi:hypothetical protein